MRRAAVVAWVAAVLVASAVATLAMGGCGRSSRELDRVTEACVEAHRHAARATDVVAATREIALGCADTYGERACAEAFRRSGAPETDPASLMRIVLEGCVSAYCPGMLPPKPDLCSRDLTALDPTAVGWDGTLRDWQVFNVRVRLRELGPSRMARIEDAMKASGEARAGREADAGPPPAPPRVVVREGKVFVDDAQVFAFPQRSTRWTPRSTPATASELPTQDVRTTSPWRWAACPPPPSVSGPRAGACSG